MEKLNNTTQILDAKLAYYHFEATRLQRFIHLVVDSLVIYTLTYFFLMLVALIGVDVPRPDRGGGIWVFRLAFVLTSILTYSFLELRFQSTLGKYLTGTKVISLRGQQLTFGQVLLRSILRFFPFDALTFFGYQRWHDSWSKTTVVGRGFQPNYASESDL